MFDKEFFVRELPQQIQGYGGSGAAMVVVRAYRGGAYFVSGIEKLKDGYVLFEVYRREFGVTPTEVASSSPYDVTVAAPVCTDPVALPYKNIAVVRISAAIRPEVGFHYIVLSGLSKVKKHEFLTALTTALGGTVEPGWDDGRGHIAVPHATCPGLKWQFSNGYGYGRDWSCALHDGQGYGLGLSKTHVAVTATDPAVVASGMKAAIAAYDGPLKYEGPRGRSGRY
jgi:hypothetical protein